MIPEVQSEGRANIQSNRVGSKGGRLSRKSGFRVDDFFERGAVSE